MKTSTNLLEIVNTQKIMSHYGPYEYDHFRFKTSIVIIYTRKNSQICSLAQCLRNVSFG